MDNRDIPLEHYFLRRLAEVSELAKTSPGAAERAAHLRDSKLLRELLELDMDPDIHLRHHA